MILAGIMCTIFVGLEFPGPMNEFTILPSIARFQLRLFDDEQMMEDDVMLSPPMDLKLVQLGLCPADQEEDRAFLLACRGGRKEEVQRRLLRPQDPNIVDQEGWVETFHPDFDGISALSFAGQHGNREAFRLLKEAGQGTTTAMTALHLTAQKGHLEVVRLLLQAGAPCSPFEDMGISPLHSAALNGHAEVLRLLLEAEADWAQATKNGMTALHFAAAGKGHSKVVRLLLKASSACDQATSNGTTALHLAALNGHLQVVRLLLEAKANCNKATNDGTNALDFATQNGHHEVVAFFHQIGAICGKWEGLDWWALSSERPLRSCCLQQSHWEGLDRSAFTSSEWPPWNCGIPSTAAEAAACATAANQNDSALIDHGNRQTCLSFCI